MVEEIFTSKELEQAEQEAPQFSIEEIREVLVEQKDIRGGFTVVTTVPTHKETEGKFLLYKDTANGIYRLYAKVNQSWRLLGSSEFIPFTITSAAQGDVLYYNGSNWVNLAAGTDGQALTTQGASANPKWSGMTTQGDVEYHSGSDRARLAAGTDGQALTTQGGSENPKWSGMTTQGDIEYHSGSDRARLAPGNSGQFLKTQGASANPIWADVVAGANFPYLGDGADGSATFSDQGIAPTGTTKTDDTLGATIYRLDRDVFYTSMTIDSTVTLLANGYRMWCIGTATITGTFTRKGNDGTAGANASGPSGGAKGTAGAILTENYLLAGSAGENGGDGANGSAGIGANGNPGVVGDDKDKPMVVGVAGKAGSPGGASEQPLSGGSGGAAGGVGSDTDVIENNPRGVFNVLQTFIDPVDSKKITTSFGTGGSGGGGAGGGISGGTAGGGGGGGGASGSSGGVLQLVCDILAGGGTITTAGGDGGFGGDGGTGGTSGAGDSGGGGGGGGGSGGSGGTMVLIYKTKTFSGTITVAGGVAGNGGGAGAAGGPSGVAGTAGDTGNTGTSGDKIEIDL